MTVVLSAQAVAELRHTMAQLVSVGLEQNKLLRANLPQLFDLATLRVRWGNLGRDAALALLRDHAGYVGQSGIPPRVPLEVVLKIDEHLKAVFHARSAARVGSAA